MIKVIPLKSLGDKRGSLVALEEGDEVPFNIKRVYYLFDTKLDVRRGYHAHKNLQQLAICVRGSCTFLLDDGTQQQTVTLNSPTQGLLLEGLLWREMHDFSANCVLLVLASEHYDENDYIREYDAFIEAAKKTKCSLMQHRNLTSLG
jgi:dTDP-4-dehydrorhamnose 3,5-epimerase-like enzyme